MALRGGSYHVTSVTSSEELLQVDSWTSVTSQWFGRTATTAYHHNLWPMLTEGAVFLMKQCFTGPIMCPYKPKNKKMVKCWTQAGNWCWNAEMLKCWNVELTWKFLVWLWLDLTWYFLMWLWLDLKKPNLTRSSLVVLFVKWWMLNIIYLEIMIIFHINLMHLNHPILKWWYSADNMC